eukprot:bmy_00608T0
MGENSAKGPAPSDDLEGAVDFVKKKEGIIVEVDVKAKGPLVKAQQYPHHSLQCAVAARQVLLLSKAAHILKVMCDTELLEEEVISRWLEKPLRNTLQKVCPRESCQNGSLYKRVEGSCRR